MNKWLLIIPCWLLIFTFSYSQNLIPNPGFESVNTLPDTIGQLYRATGWSNLNGGSDWPYATPDYFHDNATGGTKLPNTYFGEVSALEGSAVAGFITINMFQPGFREYLSIALSAPLTPGIPYSVSFYLSNAVTNPYGARGSNNIGAAFTMGQPSQNLREVVPLNPQVEITALTHHTNWQQYSFTFTPTQPFTHMTIGNFRTDAATTHQIFTGGYALSYYFIDLVDVSPASALPTNLLNLAQVESEEAVILEWAIPFSGAEGDWMLERSLDGKAFRTLSTYKDAGILLAGQTIRFQDDDARANVDYHYRLRQVGTNGEVFFSEALIASFANETNYTAGLVFPNPANEQFSLRFATGETGNLRMDLVDLTGKVIYTKETEIFGGDLTIAYDLPEHIASGIYHAAFTFKGERFMKRVMIQK
ncbi:MAG TPA: T9SS type A sorting domain-containing protein [Bacteroidetes bacterium]|nr:T9SS type A sorting domain-containing protein [Bacteroidota bacterium]